MNVEEVLLDLRRGFVVSHLTGQERLLDIGCADGFISSRSESYVGLDVDLGIGHLIKGPNKVIADAHNLPFRESAFQAVSMMEVLEHFKNPFDALLDINRVLEDGGRVYITTPNTSYVYYFMRHLIGKPTHANYLELGHIIELDVGSLKRLLKATGFEITAIRGSLLPIPPRSLLIRTRFGLRLAKQLAEWFPFASAGFFVTAAKDGR